MSGVVYISSASGESARHTKHPRVVIGLEEVCKLLFNFLRMVFYPTGAITFTATAGKCQYRMCLLTKFFLYYRMRERLLFALSVPVNLA
jgi:hypothetical protein